MTNAAFLILFFYKPDASPVAQTRLPKHRSELLTAYANRNKLLPDPFLIYRYQLTPDIGISHPFGQLCNPSTCISTGRKQYEKTHYNAVHTRPAHVAQWLKHSGAMCSRAWSDQWSGFKPQPEPVCLPKNYPRKRRHSRWKLSQELKWKKSSKKWKSFQNLNFFYTHTKMAGRTREWYKIKPKISVPFMLELKYESKIIFKNYLWLKKYVLGCKRSVPSTLSLIHIWRCRRSYACRSRWSPYH